MATTSAPLADYFWIAGIDSLSYSDPFLSLSPSAHQQSFNIAAGPPSPQVDQTIEEGSEGEVSEPVTNGTPRATARHSRQNSWNRLSKVSGDGARNSFTGLEELEKTQSNRSSITIRASAANGNGNPSPGKENINGGLGDFDFDTALMKFANERENFLDDLSFSAGAPLQKAPPMVTPRPGKLKSEEDKNSVALQAKKSPLKSVGGSIRRRISFRDMGSMKRQPSMLQRAGKFGILYGIYLVGFFS